MPADRPAVSGTAVGLFVMRRFDGVVSLVARLIVGVLRLIYAALKLLPAQNKVVLMSRLYRRTSQDFRLVRDELERQDESLEVVILNHRNTGVFNVPFQMLSEMYHLATSRACVTDSYMAPISVLKHKKSLVVVQIWHALGAIKRFGRAALDNEEGRPSGLAEALNMHEGYDWVIAGGQRMVEPFAEAFGVPSTSVLPIGTPRVDLLLDPWNVTRKKTRIAEAHPHIGRPGPDGSKKAVVLYAPTFRKGAPVQVDEMLDALGEDEFDVVVALHPLDRRDFSGRPGVTQDPKFSTLDWLAVADHVVTDYSAIVFDAAVVGAPLYFYAYDLDSYRGRRGLFLDYEREMPGPVATDAKEVVVAIQNAAASTESVARFRDEFVAPADGHCTRRVVQLALGARPDELV